MSNTTSIVKAIGEISFEGNLVPQSWNHWLKVFNGGKTSGVIPIASLILSDIVYWYRPTKVDDEKSGLVEGYKAKFAADKLQRSYNAIAEQQAITKTQAKNAVKMLEDAGVITVEFRTIDVRGTKLGNVMFLEPVPAIVKLWCKYPYKTKIEKNKEKILYGDLDEKLFDEYLSLCVKLPIPVRQKTHRSEQLNAQVFAELQTGVGKIAQTNTESTTKTSTENTTEISSETSVYIKALGRADTDESQNENSLANEKSAPSGTVSPTSHPDSRRRETHETQVEKPKKKMNWRPGKTLYYETDKNDRIIYPSIKDLHPVCKPYYSSAIAQADRDTKAWIINNGFVDAISVETNEDGEIYVETLNDEYTPQEALSEIPLAQLFQLGVHPDHGSLSASEYNEYWASRFIDYMEIVDLPL